MKKIIYTLFIVISIGKLSSQSIPEGTKYIKYIDAVVYEKNDTIKHNRITTYYDSTRQELKKKSSLDKNLLEGPVMTQLANTPSKKIWADINSRGDTISFLYTFYNKLGKSIENLQVKNGDTINWQKRSYDEFGNDIKLWNYGKSGFYLRMEFVYDDSNNIIKKTTYNEFGQKTETVTTKRDYKKRTIKSYKKTPNLPLIQISDVFYKDGIYTSKHIIDREGYNYGIKLKYEIGGYTVTKKNEDLDWIKIYNKRNELTTSVISTIIEFP